ncbi:MAG: YeiH family protein [Candidatus Competibacterales bacterium]
MTETWNAWSFALLYGAVLGGWALMGPGQAWATTHLVRLRARVAATQDALVHLGPGLAVSALVAVTAQFLSEHYGAPAMLMALLLGLAFHFLAEEGRCGAGINFTARQVLRLGVALLGARISLGLLAEVGPWSIVLVASAVVATIGFGLLCARFLGHDWRLAVLTGGSVAICGASAAAAISAVLPQTSNAERDLSFAVLGVTVLSTVAMVLYPIVVEGLNLDALGAGVFIGGTIHDVAQVVGAGFTISEPVGETATLIKLVRVSLLAPVVIVTALAIRRLQLAEGEGGAKTPLLPGFVLAFLLLAAATNVGLLPTAAAEWLWEPSRWALLMAVAAVGMKTALGRVLEIGGMAIALIVAETIFIGGFVLGGILLLD